MRCTNRSHHPRGLCSSNVSTLACVRSVVLSTMSVFTFAALPAAAKPLDADSCVHLKQQRDALEASGVRSAIGEVPPARPAKPLDEKGQRIAALIKIDGQLRFRCRMELPISTLRPELLVEVPDTIDGEPVVPIVPHKRPRPKKPGLAATTDPAAMPNAAKGTPAPQRPKTAGTSKTLTVETPQGSADALSVKPRAKAKLKPDDAFRTPADKTDERTAPQ